MRKQKERHGERRNCLCYRFDQYFPPCHSHAYFNPTFYFPPQSILYILEGSILGSSYIRRKSQLTLRNSFIRNIQNIFDQLSPIIWATLAEKNTRLIKINSMPTCFIIKISNHAPSSSALNINMQSSAKSRWFTGGAPGAATTPRTHSCELWER